MTTLYEKLAIYFCRIIAVIMVMSAHEFAHAFVAVKCGDNTPKINGRYTLNPLAHVDWLGFVSLVLFRFGWAKPVPINAYNFKNKKKGYFLTSIAGVLTNFSLAFIVYPLYCLVEKFLPQGGFAEFFLGSFLNEMFNLNLCFFVFNLIPFFPLDGFRVLECFFKPYNKFLIFLREKGQIVLLCLLGLSFIAERFSSLWFLDIFGYFMYFAINIIGYPITFFWGLFF